MSDDETADRASSGSPVFPWRGVLLGPGLIKHERIPGTDGSGVRMLCCVVCTQVDARLVEQLVRPGYRDEWLDDAGNVVMYDHYGAEVVGWVTSCGHVVWGGEWELVIPGPGRIPRWEDRRIPEKERDVIRYAAFARGEQ